MFQHRAFPPCVESVGSTGPLANQPKVGGTKPLPDKPADAAPAAAPPAAGPPAQARDSAQTAPQTLAAPKPNRAMLQELPPEMDSPYPPTNKPGFRQSDAIDVKTFDNDAQAQVAFKAAKDRLLDVNNWDQYGPTPSTDFKLYGADGKPITNRPPQEGDFVRIDLPGPGGFDWVQIENIRQTQDSAQITVRPSYDPTGNPPDKSKISHFFTNDATNTFTVKRQGRVVTSQVEGRNEKANTGGQSGSTLINTPMNYAKERSGDLLGLQQSQWKAFTKGINDGK